MQFCLTHGDVEHEFVEFNTISWYVSVKNVFRNIWRWPYYKVLPSKIINVLTLTFRRPHEVYYIILNLQKYGVLINETDFFKFYEHNKIIRKCLTKRKKLIEVRIFGVLICVSRKKKTLKFDCSHYLWRSSIGYLVQKSNSRGSNKMKKKKIN